MLMAVTGEKLYPAFNKPSNAQVRKANESDGRHLRGTTNY